MTAPLCFIDTETTGVHPGRQVWEVAMIRRDDDGQRDIAFYVEVDLSNADPFGLSVGRFYDRHPKGIRLRTGDAPMRVVSDSLTAVAMPLAALPASEAADRVAQWTHGAHLVGAVPNFDAETLDPLLRKHGLIPSWHYHLIDVESLAVGYLYGQAAGMGTPADVITGLSLPWKSDTLSRELGVEPPSDEERHTALGDARWAMRLYDAIVNGSGLNGT